MSTWISSGHVAAVVAAIMLAAVLLIAPVVAFFALAKSLF
jgi:hypothetical protein